MMVCLLFLVLCQSVYRVLAGIKRSGDGNRISKLGKWMSLQNFVGRMCSRDWWFL